MKTSRPLSARISRFRLQTSPFILSSRNALALLLCTALSLVLVAPYFPERIVKNGELFGFLGGIVEARSALLEGQFPIRVAPFQHDGARYPLFQFYANLPYTLCGLISLSHPKHAYFAWKLVLFAALMTGGFATYRLAWRWTRRFPAALAAAATFLSAPYLFTDLHDRCAMAELTAMCLLPLAALATWSAFVRPGAARVVGCALAWWAIALTHNITYLYGALIVGVLVVSFLKPRRRFVGRVGRLAAAGCLHALLVAWYIAPQVLLMRQVEIGQEDARARPSLSANLVPAEVLFWPVHKTPAVSSTEQLGLQVGWLVMLGALGAGVAQVVRACAKGGRMAPSPGTPGEGWGGGSRAVGAAGRPTSTSRTAPSPTLPRSTGRGDRRLAGITARLLLLWVVALFAAWQPIDFWDRVPVLLQFVQFSYRLLVFTTVLGALLTGLAVAALPAGRPRWVAAAVVGLLVTATCVAYTPIYPDYYRHMTGLYRFIARKPYIAGADSYTLRPRPADPPAAAGSPVVVPRTQDEQAVYAGDRAAFRFDAPRADLPARVVLPVFWYPKVLRVTADGSAVPYGVDGRRVTLDQPGGTHDVRVDFVGLPWANRASMAGWVVAAVALGAAGVRRVRAGRKASS